ncbi:hypothetical protein AF331_17715 [Rossellomorea marisflavi]|uniref:Uncharacterized protein n=1 Tax=Rossellomorea marisflavi TaxID=189381 RepID=A0A0M0G2J6_9BACI|nr:hypothetical protein [Rossellomorea marisflavi]KON83978.1 hypothetical protein AF331_17715 [Rossellomorea marisflavi]
MVFDVVSKYTGIKIFPVTITGNTWLMEVEPAIAIASLAHERERATDLTKKVLSQGEVFMAKSWEENLCRNEDCPLLATVVLIRDAEVKALQAAARLKRYETPRKHSRDVFYRKKLNVMFR